jgi:DNA-binding NtrC family response regulator
MSQHTVLVVDDEPTQRKLIQHVLEVKLGFSTVAVEGGQQAIDYVTGRYNPVPEVILLDLSMPEVDGMKVIEKLRPLFLHIPIIVLTIYGDIEKAVPAIKAGATDFLAKPVAHERLRTSILNALKINELASEVQRLRRNHAGQVVFDDMIGESKPMVAAKMLGMRAAESMIPVLLEGESGVGKELFARAIHGCGERSGQAFVAVNCGAIPENLAESILFSHEKGAFTGAGYRSIGKFREAEGGTILLDEISELPMNLQVKLLRALQQKEVEPLGASKAVKVDVRVIAASNIDLQKAVEAGNFREDLYYRLNVYPLRVPSLQERREDIAPLTKHFLRRFGAMENRQLRSIAAEALAMLGKYQWPGNIRQLENMIFRAVVMAEGEQLEHALMQSLMPESFILAQGDKPQRIGVTQTRQVPLLNEKGDMRRMRDLEEDAIHFALQRYQGRISEVARKLGIGRSTLYRKISEFGIQVA